MITENKNYFHSELTEKIIGEAFYVYNNLGSGFLEKVYHIALYNRLKKLGLSVYMEYPIKVYFDGEVIGDYFADIVVENKVIIELKAIEALNRVHEVQLVNYLKATDFEVGLLINFGNEICIRRRVLSRDHKNRALSASNENL